MASQEYLPRVVDSELADRLQHSGAVLIEGPKSAGKTATALQVAASAVHVDTDPDVPAAMDANPALLLPGATPRLFDEWQEQPLLWNHIRHEVDARRLPGQFILTGSSVPRDDVRRHSGAGRISRMTMRTMSLFETSDSTGEVRLTDLLDGETPSAPAGPLTVSRVADLVTRGGWPLAQSYDLASARRYAADYLDLLVDVDVAHVAGGRREPTRIRRLLRSLARNSASEAALSTLASDVSGTDDTHVARDTIRDYLDALDRLMIVEDQQAWSPSIRSRARLRRAPKRHLADTSLACAALRVTPDRLLKDLNTLGILFESLVVHELRVYAQMIGGEVYHYRDSNGVEADAVIELPDGRWAGCEVKLGVGAVDAGAESLLRFAHTVDAGRAGEPAALIVVTSTGTAHRRKDGVGVVPIGLLGP
jgi:predicted AAA+ superfamily ATPase